MIAYPRVYKAGQACYLMKVLLAKPCMAHNWHFGTWSSLLVATVNHSAGNRHLTMCCSCQATKTDFERPMTSVNLAFWSILPRVHGWLRLKVTETERPDSLHGELCCSHTLWETLHDQPLLISSPSIKSARYICQVTSDIPPCLVFLHLFN